MKMAESSSTSISVWALPSFPVTMLRGWMEVLISTSSVSFSRSPQMAGAVSAGISRRSITNSRVEIRLYSSRIAEYWISAVSLACMFRL